MGFLCRFRIHNTCDSIMRNMLKKKIYVYFFSNCLIVVHRQNNHSKKFARICNPSIIICHNFCPQNKNRGCHSSLKTKLKMKMHLVHKLMWVWRTNTDWHGNLDKTDMFKVIWHLFQKTSWWNLHPCQTSGDRHYSTRSHINSNCMQTSPQ